MTKVYFIQAGDGGAIKIGISDNPHKRLGKIQTDCPHRLTILAIIDGGAALEAELHARFKASRGIGEWFSPTPDLLDFITGLGHVPAPLKRKRKRLPGLLGEYLFDHELSLEAFGRLVGLSGAQLSRMISGVSRPCLSTAYAIEIETGGRVPMAFWCRPAGSQDRAA
jgi:hypothetical protein